MEISYLNSEERYIDLALMKEYYSRKHLLKSILISLMPFFVFSYLCYSRYSSDFNSIGYLSEATSSVLLIYIVCGILWIILLPILYWKLKSIIITKEIENLKMKYEGKVEYILNEEKFSIISNYDKTIFGWNIIKSVEQRSKFIIINVKGFEKVYVPVSAFKDADESEEFIRYIKSKTENNYGLSV